MEGKYLFNERLSFVCWMYEAYKNDEIVLSRPEFYALKRIVKQRRYYDELGDTVWLNSCRMIYKKQYNG